jgi:hypothetical protein
MPRAGFSSGNVGYWQKAFDLGDIIMRGKVVFPHRVYERNWVDSVGKANLLEKTPENPTGIGRILFTSDRFDLQISF